MQLFRGSVHLPRFPGQLRGTAQKPVESHIEGEFGPNLADTLTEKQGEVLTDTGVEDSGCPGL